jgi:hypothetical protein
VTRVVVVGERGDVTQTVRVGPAVLVRSQTWDDLSRLTGVVRAAGLVADALDPRAGCGDLPEPDAWLLSDLPFAAAVATGLFERLADPAGTAGIVMLGGALSFAGQHGAGGWAGAEPIALLPVIVGTTDDAREAPEGLRLRPTSDCPADLAALLGNAPPLFGRNAVTARAGATVLAEFGGGGPAIAVSERGGRRRAVFASDLMPHWGAAIADWAGLPALVAALVASVAATRG